MPKSPLVVLFLAVIGLTMASILYFVLGHGQSIETPAQMQRSSFNGLELVSRPTPPFTFAVCGHVYGQPGKSFPHPSPSLIQNQELIRKSGADFLMLLGDSFYSWDEAEVNGLVDFSENLGLPIFNAVGNHEMSRREDYLERFGPTFFAFDHGGCRMVVLDSEIDPWNLSGDQLDFLHGEIERALRPATRPRAFFVFCHKPIWAGTLRTAIASLRSNTPTTLAVMATRPIEAPTFNRNVRPALRQLARDLPVWLFAGDVGAFETETLHLYHETDEYAPLLHYAAVGIGNVDRDAFIVVTVPGDGLPDAKGVELKTGRELDLSQYDSAYWMKRFFPEGLPDVALPFLENNGR